VTALAMEFRQEFKKDVVVDIICFRKLGHNEQDEPMVTQPLMYKKIQKHPGTRKLYADKLVAAGRLIADVPEQMIGLPRRARQGPLLYNPVLSNTTASSRSTGRPTSSSPTPTSATPPCRCRDCKRLAERLTT
jgi:2-oxoglutarate dehydrogenase E1 component